jgi:NAD(P)-dependent dehydrogenase (short-subunit alcohol dehydrogenase family)
MMGSRAYAADLTGKVALVTGAGSGLGRHFAMTLAAAGARVVAAGRRADALAEIAALIGEAGCICHPVTMDVTDAASVASALAEATRLAGGPPDILVNNAGIAITKAAIDLTPGDWRSVIDTNLTGAFFTAQAVARAAREAGQGASIINVASILGLRVAGLVAPYAASKAALVQLTKALALEWARYNIRVNALAPGYIETDLNAEFFASDPGRKLIQRIPQRRLGHLTDLDGPLLLLASDASAYMTGAVIEVDGGHLVSSL